MTKIEFILKLQAACTKNHVVFREMVVLLAMLNQADLTERKEMKTTDIDNASGVDNSVNVLRRMAVCGYVSQRKEVVRVSNANHRIALYTLTGEGFELITKILNEAQ